MHYLKVLPVSSSTLSTPDRKGACWSSAKLLVCGLENLMWHASAGATLVTASSSCDKLHTLL